MTPAYLLEGRTLRLCRWAARVTEDGVTRVKGFVDQPEGLEARALDPSAWAWADGIYIPEDRTPEEVLALGQTGYMALALEAQDKLMTALTKGLML